MGLGKILDCVPRPVSDEIQPGQGQELGSKRGMGQHGAKAGSGSGVQGRYWMKWGEDGVRAWPKYAEERVREWVPRRVFDEMVPGQDQGVAHKAEFWTK